MLNSVEHGKGYITHGPGQNLSRISCSSDFFILSRYILLTLFMFLFPNKPINTFPRSLCVWSYAGSLVYNTVTNLY